MILRGEFLGDETPEILEKYWTVFYPQLLKYLHTPEFMGDMINNRLGEGPNTHPLNQHPTKGNKIIFHLEKTAKFLGAWTSI